MTSAKQALKSLLTDAGHGVKVYNDDTPPTALTGHVLDHWPGKSDFANYAWVITVGPVVSGTGEISSLGSFSKWLREDIQIDIWVMEKRGSNYEAEKTRSDLVKDVDRCLHHFATKPGLGFKVVNFSNWRELDETGLKRTNASATVEWETAQT